MGIPYVYKDTDRLTFPNGNLTWLKGSDDKLLVEFLYHTSQSPSRIERTPPKRFEDGRGGNRTAEYILFYPHVSVRLSDFLIRRLALPIVLAPWDADSCFAVIPGGEGCLHGYICVTVHRRDRAHCETRRCADRRYARFGSRLRVEAFRKDSPPPRCQQAQKLSLRAFWKR